MATLAWKLISDETLTSARSDVLDEKQLLQLKGVFLHFDDDKDGYLNSQQLGDALCYLGFSNREKFIQKFATSSKALQTATFKTDFRTFYTVIGRQLDQLKRMDEDLSDLFSFMDVHGTGYLTRKDLKHLLSEVESSPLDNAEFTRFLRSLRFSSDSDRVSIHELKRQLLFS